MNQLIKQEKDDHFQEDPLLTENKGDINIAFPNPYEIFQDPLKLEKDEIKIEHFDENTISENYCQTSQKGRKPKKNQSKTIEFTRKCDTCNETFENLQKFKQHTRDHKLTCDLCNKKFNTFNKLKYHTNKFHKDITHACGISQ